MTSILRTLAHDKPAWVGTIGSIFSTGFAAIESKNWVPQDLQGWLAAILSAITIVYIGVKIWIAVRDRRVAAGE